MSATVVLVGSGGREHALAWKLAASPRIGRLVVAPGNDGMPAAWERWAFGDFSAFAERCLAEKVDLVVVGPDNPLADGLVDVLQKAGVKAFGPRAAAAQIEASKAFAKEIMKAAGVPTAKSFVAPNRDEAKRLLRSLPWTPGGGWVVKFDGLALGKGVVVCGSLEEATAGLASLPEGKFVIEERLRGEEISWLAFCDGERCALMEPARDHKRLRDEDQGPNTGGMGAFSPVPGIPAAWTERVREEIFLPTLRELKRRGTPFQGVLYAGLMIDVAADRFWVIEFNARFGDPETQVLMLRLDGDLFEWCLACAEGALARLPAIVPFVREAAVAIVAAAPGYPETPRKGLPISGPTTLLAPVAKGVPDYFFAGVAKAEGQLVTAGGRVLAALGMGGDLNSARRQAYDRLFQVKFEGLQARSDIARREGGLA